MHACSGKNWGPFQVSVMPPACRKNRDKREGGGKIKIKKVREHWKQEDG